MAERRMFAKTIVLSDDFLDMPMSARCLYFTLGMLADDDGFVNSPRSIMRQCGAVDDDMKILIAKRFVLIFEDGVIVIKHWRINNYLQNDRHKDTQYKEHLDELDVVDGKYTEKKGGCIQNVYKVYTQDSIGKDSVGKGNNICPSDAGRTIKKDSVQDEFDTLWNMYPRKEGKKKAFTAYQRARRDGTTFEEVKQGIENYNARIKRNGTSPEYIAMGQTWFNQRRWQDQYSDPKKDTNSVSGYGDGEEFYKAAIRRGFDDM